MCDWIFWFLAVWSKMLKWKEVEVILSLQLRLLILEKEPRLSCKSMEVARQDGFGTKRAGIPLKIIRSFQKLPIRARKQTRTRALSSTCSEVGLKISKKVLPKTLDHPFLRWWGCLQLFASSARACFSETGVGNATKSTSKPSHQMCGVDDDPWSSKNPCLKPFRLVY